MSRSISQAVLDELGTNEITSFFLFQFTDGSTIHRYTDCDIPLYHATDGTNVTKFTPIGFKFDSISYSSGNIVDNASISIDNLNQVMSALFLESTIQGETATIWVCVLDSNDDIIDSVELFVGNTDGWQLEEDQISITLSNIFTRWHNSASNRYSASCNLGKFKGDYCKYAGAETTCDRSYGRCVELANSANFRGFRFLPALENKTSIWWGPTPKEQKK